MFVLKIVREEEKILQFNLLPATADNKRLAFKPFGKSAGFLSNFLRKEPADFANPNRYL